MGGFILGKWLLGVCITITGVTLVANEAGAARPGGGRDAGAGGLRYRRVPARGENELHQAAGGERLRPAGRDPRVHHARDVRRVAQRRSGRRSAHRRCRVERRSPRARDRAGQVLGERALLRHRARDAGQRAGGLRGGVEPRQAGRRLERLAARRHSADALSDTAPKAKATPAVAFCFLLNQLLDPERWARQRLEPFAGQSVELRPPLLPPLRLAIAAGGRIEPGTAEPAVRVTPAGISGSRALAGQLRHLAKHLRWGAEEELP